MTGSLDRALVLLRAIVDDGPVRADELARTVSLPLSTVYRYLRTLCNHGFVAEGGGLFAAGRVLERSPAGGLRGAELVEVAAPVLQRLVELTDETALVLVRVGLDAVCLHQVESPHRIRLAFPIGQALSLHAGAGQRTLLAHAPPDVVEAVLSGSLERYTANTPTRANLVKRLESTRHSGTTTSRAEYTPGSVAIASPVFCRGEVVGSLTVAGPGTRCGPAWQAHVKTILRSEAEALSAELEATGSSQKVWM